MMKAEVTAENRLTYHPSKYTWAYTACRTTHDYEYYIRVFVALLHKIRSLSFRSIAVAIAELRVAMTCS